MMSLHAEETTLADLLNELSEVVEWFQMGVHLEVSKGVLLKIEEDYRTVNRCMLHMLMTRMDQKELTWSDIVRALVKLKMRRLAQKIAANHRELLETRFPICVPVICSYSFCRCTYFTTRPNCSSGRGRFCMLYIVLDREFF